MYCSPFVKPGLSWIIEECSASLRLLLTPFPYGVIKPTSCLAYVPILGRLTYGIETIPYLYGCLWLVRLLHSLLIKIKAGISKYSGNEMLVAPGDASVQESVPVVSGSKQTTRYISKFPSGFPPLMFAVDSKAIRVPSAFIDGAALLPAVSSVI